ncbi:MAG: DMT family transporter [Desulfomonile tiedjei]|nr:DMT family transporter [Desulfomonile tiedjei]
MELFYLLLAAIAGACAPTQAGINSQLRILIEDPVLAALISFAVGTTGLLIYALVVRLPWPAMQTLVQLPWWLWSGGLLGAFIVAVTIVLVPKLGAATLMACMIAGQMVASLLLDHYGIVGYSEHPASIWRVLGVALVVSGVVIIKRF